MRIDRENLRPNSDDSEDGEWRNNFGPGPARTARIAMLVGTLEAAFFLIFEKNCYAIEELFS
jgi:hypothetical protein